MDKALDTKFLHREMDIYALFIYGTLIVDLYRKFSHSIVTVPFGVEMFRNLVYVAIFLGVAYIFIRRKEYFVNIFCCIIIFLLLTFFSYAINLKYNIGSYYINTLFMFMARLLPALYIGFRIVGNEDEFIRSVCKFRWLTLAYSLLIFRNPEFSESSYITISSNVVVPTSIYFLANGRGSYKFYNYLLALIGLLVIILFGGRGSLIGLLFAVSLFFIFRVIQFKGQNKYAVICVSIIVLTIFLFSFKDIMSFLVSINPSSRTLKLLAEGDLLWSSGRDGYYSAALESFKLHPFRVYGFLGDRIYFAQRFDSIWDMATIQTMFSHNVFNEWMLTLGVLPGLALSIFFIIKMISTFSFIRKRGNGKIIVFSALVGVTFINMMTSSTYLADPYIWLIFGWMLAVGWRKNKTSGA